ncbi:MAG: acyl-CoA dehydrogenase family protein [Chloroflexi bacterium]|nr:acyl-CoA dehydrogenase family protein [Chloroflexota bacterium]
MIGFELDEEQLRMKEMAHEFAEKEMRPVAGHYDETEEFPWPVMKKASDLGLLTYALPEEYGGAGVSSVVTDSIVQEELFWGCAGIATSMGAIMLGALPILLYGGDEQKKKYLPWLTQCRPDGNPRLAAFALTEPDAGSDAGSLKTSAKKVDGGYILNGTKQFITNGGIADLHTVFATHDPSKGTDGIDAFIVDNSMKGVIAGKKEKKMGIRASHTAQVILEDVFVPEENRLGEEGDGFLVAMNTLDHTRAVTAAGAVGVARAAFDTALAYSLERKQFGRAIAKQQAIQFMLSDMATEIEAARMLCWRAAWLFDHGEPSAKESSMAKQYSADMAMKVTTDAVQVLGGVGYTRDYPVEKFMRDAKIMQIYEGTSQIQRIVISRFLIGFG